MLRRTFCLRIGAVAAGLGATLLPGAPAVAQEVIFGRELMTEAEIAEQQRLMRGATTDAERERIRAEHHERMTARARERGVTLPDEPPMGGMGKGQGMGRGQGQGGGMGQGGGQRSGMGQGGGAGQPLIRKGQGAGN